MSRFGDLGENIFPFVAATSKNKETYTYQKLKKIEYSEVEKYINLFLSPCYVTYKRSLYFWTFSSAEDYGYNCDRSSDQIEKHSKISNIYMYLAAYDH